MAIEINSMRRVMDKKQKTMDRMGRIAALIAVLAVILTSASSAAAENKVTLTSVTGTVLVRPAGEYMWEKAVSGAELEIGSYIKTAGASIAVIGFSDKSHVKLMPMTTVVVTTRSPEGGPGTTVVSLLVGSAWVEVDFTGENRQLAIAAGKVFAKGKTISAFIETDESESACFEIAKGMIDVTAGLESEESVVENQRLIVHAGEDVGTPEKLLEIPNESSAGSHACLLKAVEKAETVVAGTETANVSGAATAEVSTTSTTSPESTLNIETAAEEVEEEYITITVTGSATTSFIAADESATATTEATTAPAETAKTEESPNLIEMPSSETFSETEAEKEEPEEIEIVVSSTTVMTFSAKNEEAAATAITNCEEFSVISNVMVSDEEVEDTGVVVLESDLPCDFKATATIKFSARNECAGIKNMTIRESDKPPMFFPGAAAGETTSNTYEFQIKDFKLKEMIIKAEGENGKDSFYSFTIKPQGQKSAALPELVGVTVNGISAEDGATVRVESRECGAMQVKISGSASSECGDIETLKVEMDGNELQVKGRDTWSVQQSFNEDTSYRITVEAVDTSGRASEEFGFDVELVRAVTPPEVEVQTVGGKTPSAFGGPLELYRNDLIDGFLEVKGQATSEFCKVTKVEASTDDASSWRAADGTSSWIYKFKPSDGSYDITAHAFDNSGNESEELDSFEIVYSKYTLEEKLQMAFDDIMQAYKDKDSDAIMELTSSSFSSQYDSMEDFNRLESALSDKFSEQTTVYIRYQETSHTVSGDTGRVTFSWDANPSTSGYSHTATFIFLKTTEGWKLNTVQDANTFLRHTSIAAYLTVSADRTTLYADGEDTATVKAVVRDSAYDPVKDGTVVEFRTSSGQVGSMAPTAEGVAEVEYTTGSYEGLITIEAESGGVSDTTTLQTIPLPPPGPPGQ